MFISYLERKCVCVDREMQRDVVTLYFRKVLKVGSVTTSEQLLHRRSPHLECSWCKSQTPTCSRGVRWSTVKMHHAVAVVISQDPEDPVRNSEHLVQWSQRLQLWLGKPLIRVRISNHKENLNWSLRSTRNPPSLHSKEELQLVQTLLPEAQVSSDQAPLAKHTAAMFGTTRLLL